MKVRFIGNIEARTDAKGRVFLPAVFRKELQQVSDDGLVLRKDVFQPCLVLYPASVWNEQMDVLRSRLNRWNAAHQQIFRQFVSDAEILTIDASGRRYLAMAGISQSVRFIGMGDTIEIWSSESLQAPFMDSTEFGAALETLMHGGSISTDESNTTDNR